MSERVREKKAHKEDTSGAVRDEQASTPPRRIALPSPVKARLPGLQEGPGKREPGSAVGSRRVTSRIEDSLQQVQDAVTGVNRIVDQVNAFVDFVNGTRPQISGILETGRTTLEKGNDVLEAVKNNPLLRGGVPETKEQTTTLKSYRDEDF